MRSIPASKISTKGIFDPTMLNTEKRPGAETGAVYKKLSPVEANLLHVLSNAGDAAARVLRHYFGSKLKVNIKADESPLVTIADLQAEKAIRQVLEQAVPLHGILGEELGFKRPESRYTWVLDPIDGTLAFTTGKLSFGTLIGLLQDEELIMGLIEQPILQERWLGVKGQPTTLNGKPVKTRSNTDLARAVLSVTTTATFKSEAQIAALAKLQEAVQITSFGGDCYHFGLMASGSIDVIFESGFQFYDFAAVVPVVEGAGGVITDWQGKPLTSSSKGEILACANKALHEKALNLLDHTI
ncbi:MAG TPA: inositol monophosphatase family protein [Candidatus Obscuribacter sp.]|nr:hypothetical protein [Candidatus Obscuribacter sp.]HMW89137.1 inositol monophosphatase family protein [Candidatus Obscuribacter sp.]HMX44483.1 inositol monophosphatase family protein [Candidatus Obscuribacter sp.]HNB14698.1 inositol monophosphatase family protein [Candidatus Obscuribacter sp.]HND66223.1 inositol monophosphatase family protein [Candidatus Obscuribacter sp.]